MKSRIDGAKVAPGVYRAMLGLEHYLHECGLEIPLIHLIKLRASQINGCAYCIDMHWKDLRAVGENEQRLYGLDAWRESPYYTDRERAALAWTEAVTLITGGHVDDAVYEEVRPHFSEKELADLTFAIATINAWNRLAISLRAEPGKYRPQEVRKSA
jgi:AhpD family alkylhydroperoxidase